jgi:hypothetical protein
MKNRKHTFRAKYMRLAYQMMHNMPKYKKTKNLKTWGDCIRLAIKLTVKIQFA